MKKGMLLLSSVVASLVLCASAQAATYTLNVNSALTVEDPMFKGLNQFKAEVEKRSEGQIAVKLFPSSTLGPDEDVLEQARSGAGVAVLVDGARLGPFVKDFGILGAPYLANDFSEMRKVVTSPLFNEWVEKLRKASGHQVFSGNTDLFAAKPVYAHGIIMA